VRLVSTESAREGHRRSLVAGTLASVWGVLWAGCFAVSSGHWGVLAAAGFLLVPWCIIGGVLSTPIQAARLIEMPRWVGLGLLFSTTGAWLGTYWVSRLMLTSSFDLLHEIAALFATAVAVLALWPWGLFMFGKGAFGQPLGRLSGWLLLAFATWMAWVASTAIAPIVGFGLVAVLMAVASGGLASVGLRCLLPDQGLTGRASTGLVALSLVAVLGGLAAFQGSASIREDARAASSFTHRMIVGLSALLDGDGDGVAAGLGFTDCDDLDPGVFPGATETAGNGRDDNCGGGDGDPAATHALWAPTGARGGAPTSSSFPTKTWNIVLITLDAVRADHLSLYGYKRPTSPSLSNLGKLSLVFDAAWSASNFTSLSLFSLFTGLYPSRYLDGDNILARPGMTLTEQLRAHGYRTEAIVDLHPSLPHVYAGFERVDDSLGVRAAKAVRNRSTGSTANELTELAAATAKRLGTQDTPFFLWVHYSEPHAAYLPHPQFDFGPSDLDRYDGEIAFADHAVGRLLARLHSDGRLTDTLVVVTSDHGEAFGEHGVETHGQSLFEEELHVPLIIYLPNDAGRGFASKRIPWPMDLTDVTPTLLHAVGATPRFPMHGESLLGPALDDHPLKTPEAFAETRLPYARLQALRQGPTKTIINHLTGTAWQTDLRTDPNEHAPNVTGDEAANPLRSFVDLHLARVPSP
jgi:arylsulfatase A-like enzyme